MSLSSRVGIQGRGAASWCDITRAAKTYYHIAPYLTARRADKFVAQELSECLTPESAKTWSGL